MKRARMLLVVLAMVMTISATIMIGGSSRSSSRESDIQKAARPPASSEQARTRQGHVSSSAEARGTEDPHGDTLGMRLPSTSALIKPSAAPQESTARAVSEAELQEFRAYVQANLLEIRATETARKQRDVKQRIDRIDDKLREIQRWLELDSDQRERMRALLLAQLELESYYWRQWEQGIEEDRLDELRRSDFEVHSQELAEFLSEAQHRKYLSRERHSARNR